VSLLMTNAITVDFLSLCSPCTCIAQTVLSNDECLCVRVSIHVSHDGVVSKQLNISKIFSLPKTSF